MPGISASLITDSSTAISSHAHLALHAARYFSVALSLASAGSVVVADVIYDRSSAAMLVFLITFNLIFVILGRKWIGRTVGTGADG